MSEVMNSVRRQFLIGIDQRYEEEEEEITDAVTDKWIDKSGNCFMFQIHLPYSHQDAG